MNGLLVKTNQTKRQGLYEIMQAGYDRKSACELCGGTKNLVIDHIIPLLQGGDNQPDNLRTLCHSCNVKEGWRYRERTNGDFIKYTTYLPLATIKELKRYALDNDLKNCEVMQEAVNDYLKKRRGQ